MSARPATDGLGRFPVLRLLSRFVLVALVVCSAFNAHADGDEFFASTLRSVGPNGPGEGIRIGFLGNVKDDQGHYLQEAELTVLVTFPTGDGIEEVTYKSYTDVIGRYRTLDPVDVVSLLKGVDIELNPTDIKLVGVTKDGYTQVRRLDRSRTGQTVREIDFVMKKVPD